MTADVPVVIATGAIIAFAYNQIQPLVDPLLPKAQAQHDALTRILVVLIGAVVGLVQSALMATTMTPHDVAQAVLSGCAEGVAAIATYHLAGDNMPVSAKIEKSATSPVKVSDTKGAAPLPGEDMSQSVPPAV